MSRPEKRKNNQALWLWVSVIAMFCGIASFLITVRFYDAEEKTKIIAQNEEYDDKKVESNVELSEQVVMNKPENQNTQKEDSLTIISKKEKAEEKPIATELHLVSIPQETEKESEEETIETFGQNQKSEEPVILNEFELEKPLEGKSGMPFAMNELIYSQTLKEWITHKGMDLMAEELSPVKAVGEGVVESMKTDPRYGNTIVIKHENGYQSIYANLSTLDLVYVGKKVKQGEIISGVGKGVGFEALEEPHIHLEILKDGVYLNPAEVLQ